MNVLNLKTLTTFCFVLLLGSSLFAQLDLPRKSPKSSISYTVGLTEITINYSSPSVKKRNLWGSLVPYDKVWRAGANEATTIAFSTDVKIENKELAAGKYSFFLIPKAEGKWTAIFNKEADQWGHYNYDETEDALRVDVTVKTAKVNEERLTYSIVDQAVNKGYIRFAWEKKRAYIRFKVEVMEKAKENIKVALEGAADDKKWQIFAQAADFLSESTKEADLALAAEYAEKSTSMFSHSWNWWIKAQVLAKKGDFKGAIASAAKSKEVGTANEKDNFYADAQASIEEAVAEWKTKAQP